MCVCVRVRVLRSVNVFLMVELQLVLHIVRFGESAAAVVIGIWKA